MATPVIQVEAAATRERVLEILRGLLEELGSAGALPILNLHSHLDRDLGLGSLERVELLARLEAAFGVRLPDRVIAEANTPAEIAGAVAAAPGADAERNGAGTGPRGPIAAPAFVRGPPGRDVGSVSTLLGCRSH